VGGCCGIFRLEGLKGGVEVLLGLSTVSYNLE